MDETSMIQAVEPTLGPVSANSFSLIPSCLGRDQQPGSRLESALRAQGAASEPAQGVSGQIEFVNDMNEPVASVALVIVSDDLCAMGLDDAGPDGDLVDAGPPDADPVDTAPPDTDPMDTRLPDAETADAASEPDAAPVEDGSTDGGVTIGVIDDLTGDVICGWTPDGPDRSCVAVTTPMIDLVRTQISRVGSDIHFDFTVNGPIPDSLAAPTSLKLLAELFTGTVEWSHNGTASGSASFGGSGRASYKLPGERTVRVVVPCAALVLGSADQYVASSRGTGSDGKEGFDSSGPAPVGLVCP
jgi:hypothetical protein